MLYEARMAFDNPKQDLDKHKGDNKWLLAQWAAFNKKYFGGKLKKPKNVYWSKGRRRLGCCGSDFDGKKIYCSFIEINMNLENYLTFKNTMVHEMVHQWVDETYGTKDIIRLANSCGNARSRRWWASINKSRGCGSDGHHGTWANKCAELMKKDSTLKLTKYGHTDETPLTTRQVNKKVKDQGKTHVVMQEGDPRTPRRHFYYCTDKAYKQMLDDIKNGYLKGQWTEYEFDAAKMVQEMKNGPQNYVGRSYYSGSYFDDLCDRGIINKWRRTNLGGEKTEHHRRTRKHNFFSFF